MTTLGEILSNVLTTAKTDVIKALHKLIFEDVGDRKNRARLRKFEGFKFVQRSDEWNDKIDFIKNNISTNDLIAVSNLLGIDYSGSQDELTTRICLNLNDLNKFKEQKQTEDSFSTEDEEEDDDAEGQRSVVNKRRQNDTPTNLETEKTVRRDESLRIAENMKFSLSFRDIEDTMRQFNGKDDYPVEKWIENFEETAQLYEWTELQRFVFAKRYLTGLAKLFI